MALLFFDGFDHYSTWDGHGGRKWDVGSNASIYAGRFEGLSIAAASVGITKTLAAPVSTIILGGALKLFNYGGPSSFLQLYSGTTVQLEVFIDGLTGKCLFKQGGTLLGTGSTAAPVGLWFYFELKMAPGGYLECRMGGVPVLVLSSAATDPAATGTISMVRWQARAGFDGNPVILDDTYILDGTGAANNDFLGDVRVQTRYPDAQGNQDDFSPNQGPLTSANRAAMVNAPVVDFNESGYFNYSGTLGALDLYSIGNFTVAGNIYGVQSNLCFRKGDVGERAVDHVTRVSSSNFTAGNARLAFSDYTLATKLWEMNPSTGAVWDLVTLNQAEFGVKVVPGVSIFRNDTAGVSLGENAAIVRH